MRVNQHKKHTHKESASFSKKPFMRLDWFKLFFIMPLLCAIYLSKNGSEPFQTEIVGLKLVCIRTLYEFQMAHFRFIPNNPRIPLDSSHQNGHFLYVSLDGL